MNEEDQILPPPEGFNPADFANITVVGISYASNSGIRPDPLMVVQGDDMPNPGWLFIEIGQTRLCFPDRQEWNKFVIMGEAMWNKRELDLRREAEAKAQPPAALIGMETLDSTQGIINAEDFKILFGESNSTEPAFDPEDHIPMGDKDYG